MGLEGFDQLTVRMRRSKMGCPYNSTQTLQMKHVKLSDICSDYQGFYALAIFFCPII